MSGNQMYLMFISPQDLMGLIADKAVELEIYRPEERITAFFDLLHTHEQNGKLRLQELLDCDDGNFYHDLGGIRQHMNRKTGQLEDCFVPRFTL